jgi:hypothetical protein
MHPIKGDETIISDRSAQKVLHRLGYKNLTVLRWGTHANPLECF